ncbi:MAG TPA: hypothetical protein VFV75_05425 [Candidatus Polarisedimenticolaceae bacterium]|nr:hypothetical protein [Candidatus Polarisedimenticolaceae bacterium]
MKPSRRHFLQMGSAAAATGLLVPHATLAAAPVSDSFPSHPPELAREMVGVSHGNVARVKELLAERPSLAKAVWDWGFGDWETALGAASHVGNREIAELLMAQGARPDLFTAAMLGWLDVVKAYVAANPGIQRLKGPHSIPLLAHAEAGGEKAAAVVAYLKTLEGAGERPTDKELPGEEIDALVGVYAFGPKPADAFEVERRKGGGMPGQLTVKRVEGAPRNVFHLGDRVFQPAGAEAVRLKFSGESPAKTLTVLEPAAGTSATRRT